MYRNNEIANLIGGILTLILGGALILSLGCAGMPLHDDSPVQVTTNLGYGTGFYVTENRILTALHVVSNAEEDSIYIRGLWSDDWSEAEVINISSDRDLALLFSKTKGEPVKFARSITLGETVTIVGNQEDMLQTLKAKVTDVVTDIWGETIVDLVITAPYSRDISGFSGGPLVNQDGEVLGITLMQTVPRFPNDKMQSIAIAVPNLTVLSGLDKSK
jgi:S1-C subfamily serine protease